MGRRWRWGGGAPGRTGVQDPEYYCTRFLRGEMTYDILADCLRMNSEAFFRRELALLRSAS